MGLGELVDGGRLAFRIQSIEGRSTDGSLVLAIDDGGWQIDFIDDNRLDGNVSFTIVGGAVPVAGTLAYDASAYADVGIRCL